MISSATYPSRETVVYLEAQAAQRSLVDRRRRGEIPDILWILEHPPTVTWSASRGQRHVLLGRQELARRGVAVCRSDRGGDVTFHGPGQLVGYPIVDLGADKDRDLYRYLRQLEDAIVSYLGGLGLRATTVSGRTGVWFEGSPPRKIAAIGIRANRWITSHGFAVNVENDLSGFDLIVPCGISEAAVTSIAGELRSPTPPWGEVCHGVHESLERSLGRPLRLVFGREGLLLASQG